MALPSVPTLKEPTLQEDVFRTTRDYIAVRPTTDALVPEHAVTALRALHGLGNRHDAPEETWPTIEMLLVTTGGDAAVSYLFGAEGIAVDRLERTLRRCFPNEYELVKTTASLADLLTADTETVEASQSLTERSVGALEVRAREDRAGDWQTRLQAFASFVESERSTWPLADVIAALDAVEGPAVVQTLLEPKADWTSEANARIEKLHWPRSSLVGSALADMIGGSDARETKRRRREELSQATRNRIEEIEATNTRRSFRINTRVLAFGTPTNAADTTLDAFEGVFSDVGKTTYQLTTRRYSTDSPEATTLTRAVANRTLRGFSRGRRLERALDVSVPGTTNTQPTIIADPTTAGSFCLVGGANLPAEARRAIATRPGERTGQPLPPQELLDRYRTPGYQLGYPETGDHAQLSEPIALPPALQRRHMLVAGQTGSGKSIWGINGLLANHAATDGATVLIESKDGQMADEYVRAHYADHGSVGNVYRFDAAEHVPAMPFFDVTRQQESGIPRSQAVEDIADHTEELLQAIMGTEQYERAITAPVVIETLVKALFDPVHGSDQFTLEELQRRTQRFADTGHPPPVTDDGLRRELQRIADNSEDTFTEIMAGAARRIAQAALDSRIAPLFNYAPDSDSDEQAADTQTFDWRAKLDEDCVIIIDTSDLRQESQRIVTLIVLSQLWTALRRRNREGMAFGDVDRLPLVNIHIEEAADVAASGILADILQKGRSYGVGLTLSLQYPRQLQRADEATYEEALNNIGTVVAGRVEHDRALARRLATDDMPPEDVANRLRGLAPGEWLVTLPTAFGEDPPRPFQIQSGPLPPGDPDGPAPLSEARRATLEAARTRLRERSRRHGIAVTRAAPAEFDIEVGEDASEPAAGTPEGGYGSLDTTLPFTERLPENVEYMPPADTVVCTQCHTRHGRRREDVLAAADCCGSLEDIDRDDVPPVHVGLTLSPGERSQLPYSDRQLLFLQLVYNAHQQRYDPEWEYDIVRDDMQRLRADAALDDAAFEELVQEGLLTIDGDHPHTLYTVTPDGRELIDAAHREGRAHGDDVGDLSESSYHVMMIELMRRGFESRFVDDPEHPATEVATYYAVEDGRLDVAVLDDRGAVVIAAEAERSNNDTLRAVPEDYDKMAACEPERAIWLVERRAAGHKVIRALHDPGDGTPRVDRTYSDNSALSRVKIDEPGFTDIYTVGSFKNEFFE